MKLNILNRKKISSLAQENEPFGILTNRRLALACAIAQANASLLFARKLKNSMNKNPVQNGGGMEG